MSGYQELDAIRTAQESWEAENAQQFENERQEHFESESGIPYKRIYTPLDLEEKGFSYMEELGFPGDYPYTRGRICNWLRRGFIERAGVHSHGTPEENNRLWKTVFGRGGPRFLTVVYDQSFLNGYDPDDPRSEGQVGTVGVNFASLRDWEIALDGIDINMLPIYHNVHTLSPVPLAYHVAMLEQRGLDVNQMVGVIANDPFQEHTILNHHVFPIKHALRQTLDVISWCLEHAPYYYPIQFDCINHAESGHTPVQVGAIIMAEAFFYLEAARERGIDVDSLAPRILTNAGGTHATFWENICLLRALRRIWARALRDRFGAKKPEALKLFGGTGSGGSTAMYQQEHLNNIVRSTLGALSGFFAGEWARIIPPSEPFGIADAESHHFAIQALRVMFYETDITHVVDPLGGSYFIESLTSEIEERIWKEIDTIEERGGILACLETGYFHRMREETAYKWQAAFESGEKVRVGVNRFVFPDVQQEKPVFKPYRANPESERQRIAAVQELRRKRDNEKVKKALSDVKVVAAAEEPTPQNNMVPPIIEAVKCYTTVGEITDALREVWGEYKGPGITGTGTKVC